jgi:threonine dehydratase/serine racemase
MLDYAADLADVRGAAERIAPFVHRTPVMTCSALDRRAGRALFLKCENLQKVGAFKMRGATNALLSLPEEVRARGVVTHSSGNFAQALALAARLAGVPAFIVMPRTAPAVKRSAVEGYGGSITECEPTLAAREETAERIRSETGATFVHPYDQAEIIAGQGTAALELLDEVPDLDAIVAPVGGGGLMSGISVAARGLSESIRLFGAEPIGADDAARSLAAGKLIPQTGPNTIADGLLTSLGRLTWPILRDHLERIVTVSEDEIVSAMRLVFSRAKLVIEPSAAVAVAAALSGEFRAIDGIERVGVVLSGGNVDVDRLPFTTGGEE